MATGVGMGFDLEGLDKAIKSAEKSFDNLIKKGQETEKAIVNNFKNMATQGVDVFVNKLNEANTLLARLGEGKGGKKTAISKSIDDANTLLAVVNKINSQGILSEKSIQMRGTERFVELMNTINTAGKDRTGGRIKQLNEEIDEAKKKLRELQNLLNFYTKGEGKTSYAFADTSATQREAKALMARIEMLEREKEHVQANAALRSRVNDQRIAQQNEINRQYQSALDKQSQASNNAAKAENRIYEERDKKHEETQRKYEEMGRKMNQQTMQDLAAEYEAEQRYNKQRQSNQQSQMEAMRKFAEERAKLEQKQSDKSKTDEHNRLQKEWQDQLKARDAAEKSAIKAEEERYKQQEKQRVANAVATSNNLDRINEQQHRKELQRITDAAKQQQEKEKIEAELNKKVEKEEKRKHQNELDRINKRFDLIRKREENQRRDREARLRQENANRRAAYNLDAVGGTGISQANNAMAYSQRLYSSKGLRSINNMQTAIQKMQQAQQRLNRNTAEGRKKYKELQWEIDLAERSLSRFNNKGKSLVDTSGQLKRALTAAFSVSAIKGYISQMIKVRGEFELQQTALRAILQDKDEADKLWSQVTQLAVKSPFTVRQLTAYTKQLSVYRVETEKLFSTTKMLADVSAGLGVDMQRIILAFGQVKSANFLRGTELRQFSEAGVNILGELQKYYEAIGRGTYSVGEIFEMVSKRKVLFQDVEAVFERMTSAGGVFFEMQEKQANTLQGQISNLSDAYDLMLNAMGKRSSSYLSQAISLLKDLMKNWQKIAYIVTPLLNTLVARFLLIKGIGAFKSITKDVTLLHRSIIRATTATNGLRVAMVALNAVNIIGWIITIVGALASLTRSFKEVDFATENVAMNLAEFSSETDKLRKRLEELLAVVDDETKTQEQRDKAYQELTQTYDGYLSSVDLERESIEGLNGDYQSLLFTFDKYRRIKEKSSMSEWIKEQYGDNEALKDAAARANEFLGVTQTDFFKAWNETLVEAADNSFADIAEMNQALWKKLGLEANRYWKQQAVVFAPNPEGKEKLIDAAGDKWYYHPTTADEAKIYTMSNIFNANKDLAEKMLEVGRTYSDASDYVSQAQEKIKQALVQNPITSKDVEKNKKILQELAHGLEIPTEELADVNNRLNEWQKTQLKKMDSSFVEQVIGVFEKGGFSEEYRQQISKFVKGEIESASDWIKRLHEEYKTAEEQIERYAIEQRNNPAVKTISEEDVALKKFIQSMVVALVGMPTGKSGENKELKKLKDQIAFMRKLAKDFEELWKKFGKAEAEKRIWTKARIQNAKELDLNYKNLKVGGTEEELSNLLGLENKARRIKGGNLALQASISDVQVDIDWKARQQVNDAMTARISELFGAYEISLEVESTGLPSNFLANLFGLNAIDEDKVKEELLKMVKLPVDEFMPLSTKSILETKDFVALDEDEKKALTDGLNKLDEIEKKRIEKNIDNYVKHYKDAQTEIIKIKLEGQEKLQEIDESFGLQETKLLSLGATREQITALDKFITQFENTREEAIKEAEVTYEKLKAIEFIKDGYKYTLSDNQIKEILATGTTEIREELIKYADVYAELAKEVEKLFDAEMQAGMITAEEIKGAEGLGGLNEKAVKYLVENYHKLEYLKNVIKEEIKRGVEENVSTQKWENIQNDAAFMSMFKDLDRLSFSSLDDLAKKLTAIKTELQKSGLPAKKLEEIMSKIAEVENKMFEKNPWKMLKNSFKDAADYFTNRTNYETALSKYETAKVDFDKKEEALSTLLQGPATKETAKQITDATQKLSDATSKLSQAETDLENASSSYTKSKEAIDNLVQFYKELESAIKDVTHSAIEMLDSFGLVTKEMRDMVNATEELVSHLGSMTGSIANLIVSKGTDAAAWGSLITSIMGVITASNKMADAEYEAKIQKQIKSIKLYEKAYDELAKAMENAYSIEALKSNFDSMQQNLDQQIEARNRMIAQEDAKKKSDQDAIDGWNDEIDELLSKRDEAEKEYLQKLGGVGGEANYGDIISGFVDAWLDGFMEVGDGIDALNEHFDDFIKNLVSKQLAARVVSAGLQEILTHIDKSIANDGIFDKDEWETLLKHKEEVLPQLNEALSQILEEFGATEWAGKQKELGSLSGGIQGISETQADTLAAYWNSCRYFLSTIDTNVKTITDSINIGNDVENPIVGQLRIIASQTTAINDLLNSLTAPHPTQSGRGLKVII